MPLISGYRFRSQSAVTFLLPEGICFNMTCSVGLLAWIIQICFVVVVVVFGSLLPFERYFCWVWNSDLTGFCYYSATEISFHYPLPCIVSHEKSIVIRMANYDSSPGMCFLSTAFILSSLSLVFRVLWILCACGVTVLLGRGTFILLDVLLVSRNCCFVPIISFLKILSIIYSYLSSLECQLHVG